MMCDECGDVMDVKRYSFWKEWLCEGCASRRASEGEPEQRPAMMEATTEGEMANSKPIMSDSIRTRNEGRRDGARAGLAWIEAEAADVRKLLEAGGEADEIAQRLAGMVERVETARVLMLKSAKVERQSR